MIKKESLFLFILVFMLCIASKAQELYIKPYAAYHFSTTSQQEPTFYIGHIFPDYDNTTSIFYNLIL